MTPKGSASMLLQRTALTALLAAAFALVASTAPAQASTTIDGLPRYTEWADEFRAPLPPGAITIYNDWCPGDTPENGTPCADPTTGRIWSTPEGMDRFATAHELGHVFDERVLTDAHRVRLTRLLGFDADTAWDGGTGLHCTGRQCASELFADAYATCATKGSRLVRRVRGGGVAGSSDDVYGYRPSPRRHRTICRAIASAAVQAP